MMLPVSFVESPSLPRAMLIATGIIRTVNKHSSVTTLLGGGARKQYAINFANCPIIFGQDCRNLGS